MKHNEVSIVLCGAAGQGVKTVEHILVHLLKQSGYHVFATKEYMSRIRGGSNSTTIRVSSERVAAPVDRIDILLPFNEEALWHLQKRISPDTVIVGDRTKICKTCPSEAVTFIDVPLAEMAAEVGGKLFINIIAAGVILGFLDIDMGMVSEFIRQFFAQKSPDVIKSNITAIQKGCNEGQKLRSSNRIQMALDEPQDMEEMLLNGADAVGLGALAGGCNFLSSYPMSPSTGVMVFLSQHASDFDVVVEQAEDEISAINMALGASYAGARAMVTTSGGGFALMSEGVSLAGMIETPVVIHLAQRPGPATGLPTRTEQGDLELVLYSGHGEFPRMVFAPGSLQEAFLLTQKAFNLTAKYQVPVFVLTDQYLMDTFYNIPLFDLNNLRIDTHVVKTDKGYKRFALAENGISPRGIPGLGEGLVGVDSDEHNEAAHITEDMDVRTEMVDKRLRKLDMLKEDVVSPELFGSEEYDTLLIGWGSTCPIIREAMDAMGKDSLAFLHFKQVYPIPPDTKEFLEKASQTIIIENNATSQFGKLIKLTTGFSIKDRILKYDGLAFTVEELTRRIGEKTG